jgi:hypothetical protein
VVQSLADENGHTALAGWLGAIGPFALVDGIQTWLFSTDSFFSPGPPSNFAGVVFALLALALVGICYGFLLLRYRKVSAS